MGYKGRKGGKKGQRKFSCFSVLKGLPKYTVKCSGTCSMDMSLIPTPRYNGQFCLSREIKSSYIISKINTLLIQTLDNTDTLACPLGVHNNQVPL